MSGRTLRRQGLETATKLLDAGVEVFGSRGYHSARVDDVVQAAGVSHGTFYLYFANKEELFAALAERCSSELSAVAVSFGTLDLADRAAIRGWLAEFWRLSDEHGVVISAWAEGTVGDRRLKALGARALADISRQLRQAIEQTPGRAADTAKLRATALLALVERTAAMHRSGPGGSSDQVALDTVTTIVHRAFLSGPA